MKKYNLIFGALITILFIGACSHQTPTEVPAQEPQVEQTTTSSTNKIDEAIDTGKEVVNEVAEEVNSSSYIKQAKDKIFKIFNRLSEEAKPSTKSTEWNIEDYPEYYSIKGKSDVELTKFPNEGEVTYLPIDNQSRPQGVYATITHQMVMDRVGHDADITIRPVGFTNSNGVTWNSVNEQQSIELSNGKVYNGWFYNSLHLLADSLGGSVNQDNLVTGTRMANVGNNDNKGGMQYLEQKVLQYLKDNENGIVYYSVIPLYTGEELVPRTIMMTAQSKDGVINEKVEVFNSANGFSIDYNTGAFYRN